jgi:hypothetical protein
MEIGDIRARLEDWRSALMRSKAPARTKVVGYLVSTRLKIEAAEINGRTLSGDIFPGVDWIAANGGISRRTAQEGLAELKDRGLLAWRRRSHNSNIYTLMIPDNVQTLAHCNVQGCATESGGEGQTPAYDQAGNVQDPASQCASLRAVTCKDPHRNLCSLTPENNLLRWKRFGQAARADWERYQFDQAVFDGGPPPTVTLLRQFQLDHLQSRYGREVAELLGGFRFRVQRQAA